MKRNRISRVWAMPNKYTFLVAPLREIVERYMDGSSLWFDPFAGHYSPVPRKYQNDLDPQSPAAHHFEAVDFVGALLKRSTRFDGAIFDPPYSLTQVSRSYNDLGLKFKGKENPTGGFPKVRDAIAALLELQGICVSFGWNTTGLGVKRGFEIVEILICAHGGNRNDTLVTVERKVRA